MKSLGITANFTGEVRQVNLGSAANPLDRSQTIALSDQIYMGYQVILQLLAEKSIECDFCSVMTKPGYRILAFSDDTCYYFRDNVNLDWIRPDEFTQNALVVLRLKVKSL